ncbi:ABC transporter ATP-binding protein [Natronococcus occultus]|uniref:ABC-type nitrate/sulfonate/bicarbonate transport system, ATPase component n=1 Tax=Natronococcus occultus SP4 TaxID=694430 RepID=L0JTH2_9EURY|nr:ABC transporter ATP-binding protein [Natronococcus occultus]AGB36051.1 ABC-type nitrate/sulfonate/bicarbonate transport system, ATPase component [Natronococcus occultus SP4]
MSKHDAPTDDSPTAEPTPDTTGKTGAISLDNLNKTYDPEGEHVVAVEDMDLDVAAEEFVALLGPSGCGKSTVLECIAGYLEPTEGEVVVDGTPVTNPDPKRGVVFQENRLFPWKTIKENVEFGPRMHEGVEEGRAESILDEMGLDGFEDAYPSELSGGMQQRAELARLLANDPAIMLMDEPFSALDALTKEIMQKKLLEVWERDNRTVLFITHDVEEAILLADRVAIMTARPGQIKDVIDVDIDRPRDPEVVTTDRFTELRERALSVIREEAERALEQEDGA